MNVGSNILKLALSVIPSQTVGYIEFLGKVVNSAGYDIPTYANMRQIKGSFQPVDTKYYAQMGLDFTKNYAMWYDPISITRDVDRDTTSDKIYFGGKTWQALGANDWRCVDGWRGVMFVQVPN